MPAPGLPGVTMPQVTMHRTVDAPVPVVWDVITDADVYADVAPNLSSVTILEGEGEGMVRRCVDTSGNVWTETCHRWEREREFAVAVDTETSDFHRRLFTRFEGSWQVAERPDGARITVQFSFATRPGPVGWLLGKYFAYRAPSLIDPILDGWTGEINARLDEPERTASSPPGNRRSP